MEGGGGEPVFEKISEDSRGANYRVIIDGRELVLIFTRAGNWRGGHSHDVDEVALMLKGKMEYFKKVEGKMRHFIVSTGGFYRNKAGEPHVGHFLEDSWLLDWKIDARIGEFKTTNYKPFRALVEKRRRRRQG